MLAAVAATVLTGLPFLPVYLSGGSNATSPSAGTVRDTKEPRATAGYAPSIKARRPAPSTLDHPNRQAAVSVALEEPPEATILSVAYDSPPDGSTVEASRDVRSTLHQDFSTVAIGELPESWTGSPAIGVVRAREDSWLQCDANGQHVVQTPQLNITDTSLLEVELGLGQSQMYIRFVGRRPEDSIKVDLGTWKETPASQNLMTLPRRPWPAMSTTQGPGIEVSDAQENSLLWIPDIFEVRTRRRIRFLFRDNAMLLITDERFGRSFLGHETISLDSTDFHAIEFGLDRGARLFSMNLDTMKPVRVEPTPFRETFQTVRTGELPRGWHGTAFISVGHQYGTGSLVKDERSFPVRSWATSSGNEQLHYMTSAEFGFPADFCVSVDAALKESQSIELILGGRDATPDLSARISCGRGGPWTVGFANLADVAVAVDTLRMGDTLPAAAFSLVRASITCRRGVFALYLNEVRCLDVRLAERRYRDISIGLPGPKTAYIYTVALSPFDARLCRPIHPIDIEATAIP